MCGVVGWLGTAGEPMVRAALAAISHRGPDDEGLWSDARAGVTLGHRRLSIIDLSPLGHQPMVSADGSAVIAYNGEIYNYKELRSELEAEGVVFRGTSDTEVLVEMYVRRGVDTFARLNGIFAAAIWDRNSRQMLLVRDALGVKPLYIAELPSGFAFASEIKALLPFLGSRTLDATALHRYLTFLWCPGEQTPLQQVRKLNPGEALIVRDRRIVKRWKWYELPARRGLQQPLSVAATADSVREGLRVAVHRQMVADVPVGAFLSGGLDSSAVVAFARELSPSLRCFTIELAGGNDLGFVDDLPYARRVASHLGVALDVVTVDSSRMAADFERMVWMLDEPLADPACLNVLYISELARGHGIKVLLSGAGGDDLFSGYRRHVALQYEHLWSWLPMAARRWLAAKAGQLPATSAAGRRMQRLLAVAGHEDATRMAGYFAWAPENALRALYTPQFAEQLGKERADQPILEFLDGISANTDPLEVMLALEQRFFLTDHNLSYTDRMSMAASVEVRVPFLDLELVDLAARIRPRQKQRGRVGKWALKQAMQPLLPHDIIHRPKTGFGAPLRRWLHKELRPMADELLSSKTLTRRGIFDAEATARLRKEDEAGRVDAAYTLFSIMAIEMWCRRYLDTTSTSMQTKLAG